MGRPSLSVPILFFLLVTELYGTVAFSSSSFVILSQRQHGRPKNNVLPPLRLSGLHSTKAKEDYDPDSTDVLICGGGPAGLLSAIMLAQKFPDYRIDVYDRQLIPPSPTDNDVWSDTSKHYLLGLGGRGITSLEEFGVWDDVAKVATLVPGRKDWTPETDPNGVKRMLTGRKYATHVLPRDKLVSVLHQHIVEDNTDQKKKYGYDRIHIHYQHDVRPVDLQYDNIKNGDQSQALVEILDESALVDEKEWKPITAKLVVASDGSSRTFASHIQEIDSNFSVVRYEDDNPRVYKTLPFRLPKSNCDEDDDASSWRPNLNYSVRSEGARVTFDALPANDQGEYVGVLLLGGNDEMARSNVDPVVFREFLNQVIPQFTDMLDDETVVKAAKSSSSPLPLFRYIQPRMHQGKATVLLGDCAHTVKPFFGMGANSALEDVKLFGRSIDSTPDLEQAILKFSNQRSSDIATLVQASHNLDRPGVAGVFTFLIPIILDGIFQKLAPQIFAPNIIAMIQSEEITFQQAVVRKRLDRVGQLVLLGGSLMGLVMGTQHLWEHFS